MSLINQMLRDLEGRRARSPLDPTSLLVEMSAGQPGPNPVAETEGRARGEPLGAGWEPLPGAGAERSRVPYLLSGVLAAALILVVWDPLSSSVLHRSIAATGFMGSDTGGPAVGGSDHPGSANELVSRPSPEAITAGHGYSSTAPQGAAVTKEPDAARLDVGSASRRPASSFPAKFPTGFDTGFEMGFEMGFQMGAETRPPRSGAGNVAAAVVPASLASAAQGRRTPAPAAAASEAEMSDEALRPPANGWMPPEQLAAGLRDGFEPAAARSPGPGDTPVGRRDEPPGFETPSVLTVKTAHPPSTKERFAGAFELEQAGRLPEAQSAYRQLLASEPTLIQARLRLASTLLAHGRGDSAKDVLRQGLALQPNDPRLAQPYARLLVDAGAEPEAIEVLSAAQPDVAEDPEYAAFMAALLQSAERHREAVHLYRQVVGHRPRAALWWMGLGISLEALGEHGEALSAFQTARRGAALAPAVAEYIQQRIARLSDRV